jgi:hypothetical protein
MKVDRDGVVCVETRRDAVSAEDLNRRAGVGVDAGSLARKKSSFGCT